MPTIAVQQNVDCIRKHYSDSGYSTNGLSPKVPRFGRRSTGNQETQNGTYFDISIPLSPQSNSSRSNIITKCSQQQQLHSKISESNSSSLQSLKRRLSAKNNNQIYYIKDTPQQNVVCIDKDVRAARVARLKKTTINRKQSGYGQQNYQHLVTNFNNQSFSQQDKNGFQRQNYNSDDYDEDGDENINVALHACPICNRTFTAEALARHRKVCEKVFHKKRRVFDSVQARNQGNSSYFQKSKKQSRNSGQIQPKKINQTRQVKQVPKWKKESMAFRSLIRGAQGKTQSDNYSEYYTSYGRNYEGDIQEVDDRVECRYCGRKFNADVAERHIPKCKETIVKPSRLKARGGRAAYMRV